MAKNLDSALRVVTDWNQCHGAFYRVEASDLQWNLAAQDWLDYRVCELAGVPALVATATVKGVQAGISPKTIWLSLHGPVPAGAEKKFAEDFLRFARDEGRTRAQVGGEEFHFLAGIPLDEEPSARLATAFATADFAGAEAADFGGSLLTPELAAYVEEAEKAATGLRLDLAESAADEQALAEFLLREFPGRWEREFRCWRARSDTRRATWHLLRDSGGVVLGFSRLAMRGPRLHEDWTPGALRLPGAEKASRLLTDSCLGPIGISATARGRGAGKILLGLSLKHLLLQGAKTICIDWTNAYNYYTPLGVRVLRKFRSTWKDL